MEAPSPKRIALAAVKGASALGYVVAATVFCASCSGLPLLAGLFGGLGVGARFGVSAGIVTAVVLSYSLMRRRRSRAPFACKARVHRPSQAS